MTELRDVDHTPPHGDRSPVQRRYRRGPEVVADGGTGPGTGPGIESPDDGGGGDGRDGRDGRDDRGGRGGRSSRGGGTDDRDGGDRTGAPTLRDVSHTPPNGEGANLHHVYRRGTERR